MRRSHRQQCEAGEGHAEQERRVDPAEACDGEAGGRPPLSRIRNHEAADDEEGGDAEEAVLSEACHPRKGHLRDIVRGRSPEPVVVENDRRHGNEAEQVERLHPGSRLSVAWQHGLTVRLG